MLTMRYATTSYTCTDGQTPLLVARAVIPRNPRRPSTNLPLIGGGEIRR